MVTSTSTLTVPALRTPVRPLRRAKYLLQLSRPGQWPKNLLVVSVPLLDLRVWQVDVVWKLAWGIATFTLAAVIVYVLNDLADRARDAGHPKKWHRPIASGRVSARSATVFAVTLLAVLLGAFSLQPWSWSWPIVVYLLLNVGYSAGLKHTPLLDVFMVAAGFGLRLLEGYLVLDTPISGWLFTTVFTACLLLAVGKRRQELVSTGGAYRPALRGYSVPLTEQLMMLSGVLAAVSYLQYLRSEAPLGELAPAAAAILAPLMLFTLFRYLQLVMVRGKGENPVRTLLRDRAIVVNALVWAALSTCFLVVTRMSYL